MSADWMIWVVAIGGAAVIWGASAVAATRARDGRWGEANESFPQLYPGVVADFERAEKQAPNDGKVLDYLGRAYVITGQKDKAITVRRRAERNYRNPRARREWKHAADDLAQRRAQLEGG